MQPVRLQSKYYNYHIAETPKAWEQNAAQSSTKVNVLLSCKKYTVL